MLVGDSITEGVKSSNGLGLRGGLVNLLKTRGHDVVLVGSEGVSPYRAHYRSGGRIGDFYAGPDGNGSFDVAASMDAYLPEVVTVHLGSNDVFSRDPIGPYTEDGGRTFATGTLGGRMAYLLSHLVQWCTEGRAGRLKTVFVSKIIPRPDSEQRVALFNDEVARIVRDSEEGSIPRIPAGRVRLVDQWATFHVGTMMGEDGIHPNDAGYSHMAGVCLDAFELLPARLAKVSGDDQDGPQDAELDEPLVVRVLDGRNRGISGIGVGFEVLSGDAVLVDSADQTTDAEGAARVRVRTGAAGALQIRAGTDALFEPQAVFSLTSGLYAQVRGLVGYSATSVPVPNVRIRWLEDGIREDTTGADGAYRINKLPLGGSVTLQPEKTAMEDFPAGTVLSYDAALAARHVAGYEILNPAQRSAADADGDGVLSAHDAFCIARFAAGFWADPNNRTGEWRFTPATRTYGPIHRNFDDQHFSGVLAGDVDGNWAKNSGQSKAAFQARLVVLPPVRDQGAVAVPIAAAGKGVLSCDLVCRVDPGSVDRIRPQAAGGTQLAFRIESAGRIRIGAYRTVPFADAEPILVLEVKPKERAPSVRLMLEQVFVNDSGTEGFEIPVFTNGTVSGTVFQWRLQSGFPNPFNASVVLPYTIAEASNVRLSVLNCMGKELARPVDGFREAGAHAAVWDGLDRYGNPAPSGCYLVVLHAGGRVRVIRAEKIR